MHAPARRVPPRWPAERMFALSEVRLHRRLRVGERALNVTTNDATVAAYLDRACARLMDAPSADAELDEGVIAWDGREASVWFNARRIAITPGATDALEAGVRGVSALLAAALRLLRRQQALYAVGLSSGVACIAVAASPGVGKTTLALELLGRGWSTFGDEFLLLDRETLAVEGIPLALMVREPSLAALGNERLSAVTRRGTLLSNLGGVRTWHDLDVEEAFGRDAVAAPRPLTHLIVYDRGGTAASLESISPATATLAILPHFFIDSFAVRDIWEIVARLERVQCFRLRARDHRCAADELEKLA